MSFPDDFRKWAGYSTGGVRKPFDAASGRPAGQHIKTPLTEKLQRWAQDLVRGEPECPRVLFLIGGPGNGKTDAVETFIDELDICLNASGGLISEVGKHYNSILDGSNAPRRVEIELASCVSNLPSVGLTRIVVVQDATQNDARRSISAESLLLEEVQEFVLDRTDAVFLCCLNRGILANAMSSASASSTPQAVDNLLMALAGASTSGPYAPQCWPLECYPWVAAWPMDIESLVGQPTAVDDVPVAARILAAATDPSDWRAPCEYSNYCPFCTNQRLLADPESVQNLVKGLRYFELGTGKRWTFRDLYSLIAHVLVGDPAELAVGGKTVHSCEWTAAVLEADEEFRTSGMMSAPTALRLSARLYHHRLFPNWPKFDAPRISKARAVLDFNDVAARAPRARELFNYFAELPVQYAVPGEVATQLRGSFSALLDPALASGETHAGLHGRGGLDVATIEDMMSVDVASSLAAFRDHIAPLESATIEMMAVADMELSEEHFSRIRAPGVAVLRAEVRQIACRFLKRAIFAPQGVYLNHQLFADYSAALREPANLEEVRGQLRRLLHDNQNYFSASLTTTFGQPMSHYERDIVLCTPRVPVSEFVSGNRGDRPPDTLPYVVVDGHPVPMTFALYRSLVAVAAGLHEASLPSEIFALLDSIRGRVVGRRVRADGPDREETYLLLRGPRLRVKILRDRFQTVRE